GFPTLKAFGEKRSKRGRRRAVDYQGARKASAMAAFARSLLPSLSTRLGADGLEAFVAGAALPAAVLLTERAKPGDLWRGLAARFDRRVRFAHMAAPAGQVLRRLGIDRLPAVAVFADPADPGAAQVYAGEPKHLPLARFIHAAAVARSAQPGPDPLAVQQIETQADLERLCIAPAEASPVPVLCIIGVVALEPAFAESRAEHARAVAVLESVLRGQQLRSPHAATGGSGDDDDDDEIEAAGSAPSPPLRAAWVNGLGAAGQQVRALFGLSDDLPTAVAVNPRKRAAAPYRGSFASADMLAWAEQCYGGRGMRRLASELRIADAAPAHDEL
ncbi:hypothetical protein H4R23_006619, partial [Coemansia sp. Cherry 401B]